MQQGESIHAHPVHSFQNSTAPGQLQWTDGSLLNISMNLTCNGLLLQKISGNLMQLLHFPEDVKGLGVLPFTMPTTCSSMRFAVSGAQARDVTAQILVGHCLHGNHVEFIMP